MAKRGNRLSDYISGVEYASAGLWICDSPEAIRKRSFSFKRHICESIEQIPAKNNGVIHICYEYYDGQTVEKLNFDRTYNDLKELNIKNKIIKYVYLHNLRFFWPPDKNWEVEEDVFPFTSNFFTDEYFISGEVYFFVYEANLVHRSIQLTLIISLYYLGSQDFLLLLIVHPPKRYTHLRRYPVYHLPNYRLYDSFFLPLFISHGKVIYIFRQFFKDRNRQCRCRTSSYIFK